MSWTIWDLVCFFRWSDSKNCLIKPASVCWSFRRVLKQTWGYNTLFFIRNYSFIDWNKCTKASRVTKVLAGSYQGKGIIRRKKIGGTPKRDMKSFVSCLTKKKKKSSKERHAKPSDFKVFPIQSLIVKDSIVSFTPSDPKDLMSVTAHFQTWLSWYLNLKYGTTLSLLN